MLVINPRIAEIHFNLAAILTQLNDNKAAINSYLNALKIKPGFTMAHFNVGALLNQLGKWQEAAGHFQQAVEQQPGFYEAWVNLGAVLQTKGDLKEAERCYRQALALRPDARGYFNLGTAFYGQGERQKAIAAFQEALRIEPKFADAWNGLGESYRDQGDMAEAVNCYKTALQAEPGHARANYNLGEFHCLAGEYEQAIPYFAASGFADSKERILLCLYKTRRFDEFEQGLNQFVKQNRHDSVLLASLSTHYAINFKQANPYRFCANPMEFVQHTQIEELATPGSPLLSQLLDEISQLAIAERKQGRLYYGIQSAGNLLQRPEPAIGKLAGLIRAKVLAYRQHFSDCDEALIRRFPKEVEFASSWYLKIKKGGYLTSHIHEEGWISGCVYLKLPDKGGQHEGSFEVGTDGDGYPKLHEEFPFRVVDQKVGDLVLFPSSLFHRTIPFHSDQERVCIAFDIKPQSDFEVT